MGGAEPHFVVLSGSQQGPQHLVADELTRRCGDAVLVLPVTPTDPGLVRVLLDLGHGLGFRTVHVALIVAIEDVRRRLADAPDRQPSRPAGALAPVIEISGREVADVAADVAWLIGVPFGG